MSRKQANIIEDLISIRLLYPRKNLPNDPTRSTPSLFLRRLPHLSYNFQNEPSMNLIFLRLSGPNLKIIDFFLSPLPAEQRLG